MILIRIIFFLIYLAIALIIAPLFGWFLVFSTAKEVWKVMGKYKVRKKDIQNSQLDKEEQEIFSFSGDPKYRKFWN